MNEDGYKLANILNLDLFEIIQNGRDVRICTWLERPDGYPIYLYALRSGNGWIFVTNTSDWDWAHHVMRRRMPSIPPSEVAAFVEHEMVIAAMRFKMKIGPQKDGFAIMQVPDGDVASAVYRLAFGMMYFLDRAAGKTVDDDPGVGDLFL